MLAEGVLPGRVPRVLAVPAMADCYNGSRDARRACPPARDSLRDSAMVTTVRHRIRVECDTRARTRELVIQLFGE